MAAEGVNRNRWGSYTGALLLAVGATFGTGCVPRSSTPFQRQTDDDAGGLPPVQIDAGTDARDELPAPMPHSVLGVDPPHGPFAGGTLAVIRGSGFTSDARVWVGSTELAADSRLAIDPQRLQVTVPAGSTGAVDVTVQDGDDESTKAALPGGYTYDSFYADPSSGPTSGGTIITLKGDGTNWDAETHVLIDGQPCELVALVSATELDCRAPPGTAGTKAIRVTTSDGVSVDVLDAFIYGNSDNGFKGGLSGQALDSELRVLAFDNFTGLALNGATVVVGDTLDSAEVLQTDANGVATLARPGLGPARSVTVARRCYQPITFAAVPVDTVTAYLDPVLSPACGAGGDLPASGGTPLYAAQITGEVVWPATGEFRRDGWTDVPALHSSDERYVAYVFQLSGDPTFPFQLPPASNAVTPSSDGTLGYGFSLSAYPGNFALYALAGIENRTLNPPQFTAYSMGLVQGVRGAPGEHTSNVYLTIDVPLDHALRLDLVPPDVTARGPDRVQGSLAIRVGNQGYITLPSGFQSRLLPLSTPLSFVGVPPLTGSLTGLQYVTTARAVTGSAGGAPLSVLGLFSTITSDVPLTIDQFVQVPLLTAPEPNGTWNGVDLAATRKAGGADVDLFVYELESGSGLVAWRVVTPGSIEQLQVPDLAAISADLGLIRGPLSISVSAAHLADFSYSALRYRDMTPRRWSAYASDVFFASY